MLHDTETSFSTYIFVRKRDFLKKNSLNCFFWHYFLFTLVQAILVLYPIVFVIVYIKLSE